MTNNALAVTVRELDTGILIEAIGVVDLTTAKDLAVPLSQAVQTTVAASVAAGLSVDLRKVDFIDSAGLALLVDARKQLARAHCWLQILVAKGAQPERVLRMGRFDTIMTLKYDDDAEV